MSHLPIPQTDLHDVATVETPPPLPDAVIDAPAPWFTGRTADAQGQVRFVPVDGLKEHPACDSLPFIPRVQADVHESLQQHGVLYPLAVATDGRVLDGRYRLRAARMLGLTSVPVLTVDVAGDDAVKWVFTVKNDREHLSEGERTAMAVQYQERLSGDYIKVRAKKMTAARLGKTEKRHSSLPKPQPKLDSRREACAKFKVPTRKFNAMKRMAKDRPDLYKQVITGEMDADAALKRKGKNRDLARATEAMAATVRPEDVTDGQIENRIHEGEAQDVLDRVADGTASLVLFSPPYFQAKVPYEPPLPLMTYDQYKEQLRSVLTQSFRVSRDGGRLAMILDTVNNPVPDADEMLPLAADATAIARACGWRYWTDIAWIKPEVGGSKTTFGSYGRCSAPGWGRDHEWILVFFKGTKKLPGDEALCDLTREEHLAWWRTTWKLNAETRRDILDVHPAPFPEAIPERLIKLLTYRRDLVIDPYVGSGTSAVVAARLERKYIGIDRSKRYCDFARNRISALKPADTMPVGSGTAQVASREAA